VGTVPERPRIRIGPGTPPFHARHIRMTAEPEHIVGDPPLGRAGRREEVVSLASKRRAARRIFRIRRVAVAVAAAPDPGRGEGRLRCVGKVPPVALARGNRGIRMVRGGVPLPGRRLRSVRGPDSDPNPDRPAPSSHVHPRKGEPQRVDDTAGSGSSPTRARRTSTTMPAQLPARRVRRTHSSSTTTTTTTTTNQLPLFASSSLCTSDRQTVNHSTAQSVVQGLQTGGSFNVQLQVLGYNHHGGGGLVPARSGLGSL
jgi:hypothetical protein